MSPQITLISKAASTTDAAPILLTSGGGVGTDWAAFDLDLNNQAITSAPASTDNNLWVPTQSSEKPCLRFAQTSDLEAASLFTIHVSGIPTELVGQSCYLKSVSKEGLDYSFRSETLEVSGATADFEFQAPGSSLEAPTGIRGLFEWEIVTNDSIRIIGSTQLELYTIPYQPSLFPKTYTSGVPLQLLRMFLLPLSPRQQWTQKDWIALVAGIAHGSRQPVSGLGCKTEDHWLKYETYAGQPSFISGQTGGEFNLNAWLVAYRYWKTQQVYTCVNCFDQAAIVEVALVLGIPAKQVIWEFHKVFGFIPETANLVGWGGCNNPYFCGDRRYQVVDSHSERRQPFRTHAYISWNPNPSFDSASVTEKDPNVWDKDLNMLVIDACAGPHFGTENREAYNDTKDKAYPTTVGGKAVNFLAGGQVGEVGTYRWEEQHEWGTGVTSTAGSHAAILLATEYGNDYLFKSLTAGEKVTIDQLQSPVGSENQNLPYAGDVQQLLLQFDGLLKQKHGEQTPKPVFDSEWTLVPIPPIYRPDGVQVEHKLYALKDIWDTFGSIRVFVAKDHQSAMQELQTRIAQFAISSPEALQVKTMQLGVKAHTADNSIKVVGSKSSQMFVWCNIMVQLTTLNVYASEPALDANGKIRKDSDGDVVSARDQLNAKIPILDGISQSIAMSVRSQLGTSPIFGLAGVLWSGCLMNVPGFDGVKVVAG